MMKNELKVIQGGIMPKEKCEKKFISSYVTDTRLMGAMGLFVRWELVNCDESDELIQFFFFDTEEFGLENYESLWGYNQDEIFAIEHTSIDCLGGKKIPLSEHEACFMIQYYFNMNIKNSLPLPRLTTEYQFILDKEILLSEEAIKKLDEKTCTPILSNEQCIHYFLMRLFGKDFKGALYMTVPHLSSEDINVFSQFKLATFCKNTVTPLEDHFTCKSIINTEDGYYIVISKIKMTDFKVSYVEMLQNLHVSTQEAALILSNPEYISVYDILGDFSSLKNVTFEISFSSNSTFHDNGRLIMIFKKNNNHVNQKTFTLSDDIYGTYFISNTGQFILTSYNLKNLHLLEDELLNSSVGKVLSTSGKFAFREPVLYDFIGSDFDDFIEFVEFIQAD